MNLQKEIQEIVKKQNNFILSDKATQALELLFLTKLREEKEKEFARLFDLKTFHDSIYLHNTVNAIREECIEITNRIKKLGGEV